MESVNRDKKKTKIAIILDFCIFGLEILANVWMMSGIKLSNGTSTLTATRLSVIKYFTIDSNIIMGIFALIVALEQIQVLKGKKTEVSTTGYILALMGTAGLTLTMLVTIFFLAPTMAAEYGWFANFKDSNFLLHLLNPILSIVVFLGFEKTDKIKKIHTCTAILPLVIYACYYIVNVISHAENGIINKAYDWYGFFMAGIKSIIFVLPIIILVAYLISFGLWKLNRKK